MIQARKLKYKGRLKPCRVFTDNDKLVCVCKDQCIEEEIRNAKQEANKEKSNKTTKSKLKEFKETIFGSSDTDSDKARGRK